MNEIVYRQIGVIHSPFKEPRGTPIQATAAAGIEGRVEVFEEFCEGLKDLEGFSHIILVYHFHLSREPALRVIPFMDDQIRGVFATRAPNRPNPIGISVVRLESVEGNILHVKDLDILEGTPVLDIKPYVPEIDIRETGKTGWLENNINKLSKSRDDGRFKKE